MYYLGKRYLKDHLKGEGGDLPGGGGGCHWHYLVLFFSSGDKKKSQCSL